MSVKKVKEVDSMYQGGSKKRSRIFDDISCSSNATSVHWTSVLSCCWKHNRERKPTLKENSLNEWDYIVEKLVVKRIPLSLYATEEDFQELTEERSYKESSYGPMMGYPVQELRDKQVYSAMNGMGSTLYFLRNKSRGDLSNKSSTKNFRFNRAEDLLDEDALAAGPSNYNRDVTSNLRMTEVEIQNEYLNQFSALHPDLKESDLPPKDPCPLNPPLSMRSLAEKLSEIASTKKIPSAKVKKGKDKRKQGSNAYVTVSNTSREISTVLGREEDTPKPDVNEAKYNSSMRHKISSTSCSPYARKPRKMDRQIHQEVDSPYNDQYESSIKRTDRDSDAKFAPKASQFKVHYINSPQQYSTDKVDNPNSGGLEEALQESQQRDFLELSKSADEEFPTIATSYSSDDLKTVNQAGTTLRWKIIIKHQPSASQTACSASASDLAESSTMRTIAKSFNASKASNRNTDSLDVIRTDHKLDVSRK